MTKVIAEYTGSITIPSDNTVRFLNDDNEIITEVYDRDLTVITLTDMDGDLWVYTVPDGYTVLVNHSDIVNKHAVLAHLAI